MHNQFAIGSKCNDDGDAQTQTTTPTNVNLVCTGFDAYPDLKRKYKNVNHILNQIQKLNTCNGDDGQHCRNVHVYRNKRPRAEESPQRHCLSICVRHGVNALALPFYFPKFNGSSSLKEASNNLHVQQPQHRHVFDHVLFNHPHLGTENAKLHHYFLCHLFHSVTQVLKQPTPHPPSTIKEVKDDNRRYSSLSRVYITLARGQYERWRCEHAASLHGFVLLHRCSFTSPLLNSTTNSGGGSSSSYETRRHQSGKAFGKRVEGSETFTFGLLCVGRSVSVSVDGSESESDKKVFVSNDGGAAYALPWQVESCENAACSSNNEDNKQSQTPQAKASPTFVCNVCSKSFREARSLKNHQTSCCSTKYRRAATFTCQQCEENGTSRIFSSRDALSSHVLAKHSGAHTDIKPDWYVVADDVNNKQDQNDVVGTCDICKQFFFSHEEERRHDGQFLPREKVVNEHGCGDNGSSDYVCAKCFKRFRDTRALLQHEIFCKAKQSG